LAVAGAPIGALTLPARGAEPLRNQRQELSAARSPYYARGMEARRAETCHSLRSLARAPKMLMNGVSDRARFTTARSAQPTRPGAAARAGMPSRCDAAPRTRTAGAALRRMRNAGDDLKDRYYLRLIRTDIGRRCAIITRDGAPAGRAARTVAGAGHRARGACEGMPQAPDPAGFGLPCRPPRIDAKPRTGSGDCSRLRLQGMAHANSLSIQAS
jgi:hypothetical protein